MEYVDRCVKLSLPNGQVVDILRPVLNAMGNWLQTTPLLPESCGFLLGYMNRVTKNITISELTTPKGQDKRTRYFCRLQDKSHFRALAENRKKANYYMGLWHTHPQAIPSPSAIDWTDWYDTLMKDKTGSEFIFYIIAGITEFRVWAGEIATGKICEIFEVEIFDGVYLKGDYNNAN